MPALLDGRANTQARSNDGATVLMMAAASGNVDLIRALLDRGAEIDARDSSRGQTPLMFAAAANRAQAVKLLVARGATVKLTSTVVCPAETGSSRPESQCTAPGAAEADRCRLTGSGGPSSRSLGVGRLGGAPLRCARRTS